MRTPTAGLLAVALLYPTSLGAQAPVITPDGDPSLDAAGIYALAVDAADHPEETLVLLLDDGVVRYDLDGTGSRTYRMVGQILKQEAVEGWAEHTFSYNPERERFRLNWVRVVDLDGTVISDEPMHRQETELPVPEGSPVFSPVHQVRVSMPGVEVGTIVDYSYTVETFDPVLGGDFFASWYINPGSTIRRSRLILDLPAGMDARIHEIDVAEPPTVTEVDGRIVREWSREDIPMREPEPFVPDSTGYSEHIRYGGPVSWSEIGDWYRGLAAGRYEMTPVLTARLEQVVADAATLEDRLRALHRWIAQDIRYVSLSLGIGGYQPRMPAEVLETLSGDCKDKATLFIAMARALGAEAHPVLTSAGRIDATVPSLRQFDHAIAAVDLGDGEPIFVDLTASIVPWGHLPGGLHGGYGLIVRDDDSELLRFADPPATESRLTTRLVGELAEDGTFRGRYEESATGLMQYELRGVFAEELTRQQEANAAQAVASQLFPNASGDSLQAFDGFDLTADPRMTVRVEAPATTTRTPTGDHILPLPLPSFGNLNLLRYLESREEERRAPFHIGQVSGDNEILRELVLDLPEGWTAVLPEPIEAESRFGSYRADFRQEGRTVHVTRRYLGGRGIAPPDARPELIEWLRAMLRDDVRYLVLRPPAEEPAG